VKPGTVATAGLAAIGAALLTAIDRATRPEPQPGCWVSHLTPRPPPAPDSCWRNVVDPATGFTRQCGRPPAEGSEQCQEHRDAWIEANRKATT
jgi:hypothetical protein